MRTVRMKHGIDLALLGIYICFVSLIGFWAGRNYLGYCSVTGIKLSDEEKIDIAITDLIHTRAPGGTVFIEVGGRIVDSGRKANADVLAYRDLREFKRTNKGCCRVVLRWPEMGGAPGIYDRVIGKFSGFVRIDFVDRIVGPDGSVQKKKNKAYLALTNCGRVWDGL